MGAPHAHPIGGLLKSSIKSGGAVQLRRGIGARRALMTMRGRGTMVLRAQVYAFQPYASYVNDGFFHRTAKRRIRGRKFMELGVNHTVAFYLDNRLERAVQEIFLP